MHFGKGFQGQLSIQDYNFIQKHATNGRKIYPDALKEIVHFKSHILDSKEAMYRLFGLEG